MTLLKVIESIRALTHNSDADQFFLAAIRAHATKVRDTRKDQPGYSLKWRNLAILTLKEIDDATDNATATV